jgi:uncharacterized protein
MERNPPHNAPQIGENERERRAFNTIFTRAAGEGGTGRTVSGYAAIFGSTTSIGGWWNEIIEEGAFDDAISTSDARALFNHKPDHLLARQSSGTLKLSLDNKGLMYEFESPNTGCGNDILEMMNRGDLKESSFAFTVKEEEWLEEVVDGESTYTRRIKKVDTLYDVSPVTYPAYGDTTVSARSMEEFQKAKTPTPPAPKGTSPAVLRLVFGK